MTVFTTKESFIDKNHQFSIEYDGKYLCFSHTTPKGLTDCFSIEKPVWYKIMREVDVVINEYDEVQKRIEHA